jgi:hypothetical protein
VKHAELKTVVVVDEYGHPAGAQVKIRAEAFMEMLESRGRIFSQHVITAGPVMSNKRKGDNDDQ